jgi:hypothetical protein
MVILKLTAMKKLLYLAFFIITFTGCSIDNYEMPSVTVTGKIVDSETKELVASGGTNGGTIVRFYENNSTQPLIYRTLPDGNFVNEAVFPGNYSYTAEGPFRPTDTSPKAVAVNGNTEVEIPVVPYLRLKVSVVSVSGNTAEVKVEYQKVKDEDVFTNLGLVYSTFPNPNTFTSVGGAVMLEDVSGQDLTSGEKTYTVTGLTAGKKYYFRAVGLAVNPGSYFNYSSQAEADVQ